MIVTPTVNLNVFFKKVDSSIALFVVTVDTYSYVRIVMYRLYHH